jgi:hypothetical protein
MLLCVLAWYTVTGSGASIAEAATVGATIAGLVLFGALALAARADEVVIGYKG